MLDSTLLRLAAVFAAAGFLAASGSAAGYNPWTVDDTLTGAQLAWRAGSSSPPWDNPSKTLTCRLNTLNFPLANSLTAAQAGAALLNGLRSIEDIADGGLRLRRGPNVQTTPSQGDGQFHLYFHTSTSPDPFGTDLSGSYAVTYPFFSSISGTMLDADIFFNAIPTEFDWSITAPNPPGGSSDIETTFIHEALHAVGLLHPVYFSAAVWPVGRLPELAMFDRIYAPDDRAGLRRIYAPAGLGRITGTVSVGAGAGDRAIVVATDADGVPQATIHTLSNGAYDLSVPPGTYSVTAHHASNSTYSGELNFVTATPFVTATTVTGVVVSAGAVASGTNITCTAGTPTMKLILQGPVGNLQAQTQYLAQNASGTLRLAVRSTPSSTFTAADVAAIDLGPGITAALGSVGALNASTTAVNVTYSVSGSAAPGFRNVSLLRTSGERLFLPSIHAVASTGTLSFANGPANPAPAVFPGGALDQPLLQVRFDAGPEDVRLRRLDFTVNVTGEPAVRFNLWRDVDGNGVAQAGVDERILTSAAYALAVPADQALPTASFDGIAVSLPAGTLVDLLLTMDASAVNSGTYAASLAPAGLFDQAHGMAYGDVLAPTGAAAGGTQSLVALVAGTLGQFEAPAGTVGIPVGGATSSSSIVLRSVVTASSGSVGLDVEVRPLGAVFTGTPTDSSPPVSPSGTDVAVTVGSLADGSSYHWRARPTSSGAGAGAWVTFGANAETARDFSRDTSTTTLLPSLAQKDVRQIDIPLGGTGRSFVYLSSPALNSAGLPVRLEVEAVPAGQAFSDAATGVSPLVASGSTALFPFQQAAAADLRWQARAVSSAGSASAWSDFGANGTSTDFHYEPGPTNVDDTECDSVSRAGTPPAALGALALLLLLALRRG